MAGALAGRARGRDHRGALADVGGGGPRRAAAPVPPDLLSLRAHRVAGHPAGAGAGPRRVAHERGRALPPAAGRPAGGGALRAGRGARPLRGPGRRARAARLRARRAPGAAPRARGPGTTSGSRPPARPSCCWRWPGRIAGVAEVETYPELQIELGARRAGACGARSCCCAAAPFAGRARAAGGGPCLSRSCAPSASPTPTRRRGAGPARREPRARARHVHRARRASRDRASPRSCARSAASCPTSTAVDADGRADRGRACSSASTAPGELAAVCGTVLQDPEAQVVMGGVRAELELPLEHGGEPAAVDRARGRGDRAGAREWPTCSTGAPTPCPAASSSAWRSPPRWCAARAAAARRAHLAARPGGGRRARVAAAAAERGLGHGRGDGRAPARALPAGRATACSRRGRRAWPATPPRATSSRGPRTRRRGWPPPPPGSSRSPG